MNRDEPKFDAQLVGVYDRSLGFGKHETSRFYMKDPDVEFDGRILEAIGHFTRVVAFKLPATFLEEDKKLLEKRRVECGVDPEIMEILQRGKIKIDLLIDADGALVLRTEGFHKYLNANKKRGGEFNAYGGITVSSGAARTWQNGDERSLLDMSRVLWHAQGLWDESINFEALEIDFGIDKETSEQVDREDKEKDLAETQSFLEGAIEPYRSRYLEILKEDHDSRHEIIVFGDDLKASGLAHNVFDKIGEMKARFETDCDWAKNKPRVKKFWTTIRRQEREIIDAFLLWVARVEGKNTEL